MKELNGPGNCAACGSYVTGGHFRGRTPGMVLEPCGCVFVQTASGAFVVDRSASLFCVRPAPEAEAIASERSAPTQDPACRGCGTTGEGDPCRFCAELESLRNGVLKPELAPSFCAADWLIILLLGLIVFLVGAMYG